MKLFLFLLIISTQLWAKSESQCHVVNGFYQNSETALSDFKLETYADIFTLNNAKTLSLKYDGQEIRFQRYDLLIKKYTKMYFAGVGQTSKTHAALLTIDRKPKAVLKSQEFYASLMITMPLEANSSNSMMIYNLYCSF